MSTAKMLDLEARHPSEEKSVKWGICNSSFLIDRTQVHGDSLLEVSNMLEVFCQVWTLMAGRVSL